MEIDYHYWRAESKLVDMLLKVGADKDVNHEFEVGVTPIMVAAKFGDAATFQLVLAAGADIRHCHFNNKDCLELAVENCHFKVIQMILDYTNTDVGLFEAKFKPQGDKSFVDRILRLKAYYEHHSSLHGPDGHSMIETMCFLRRRGSSFSWDSHSAFDDIASMFQHDGSGASFESAKDFKLLGQFLIGEYIPKTLQPVLDDAENNHEAVLYDKCKMCSGSSKKMVRLYCGHDYCRKCIIRYGRENPNCRICGSQLCLEVLQHNGCRPSHITKSQLLGWPKWKSDYMKEISPSDDTLKWRTSYDLTGASPTGENPHFGSVVIEVTVKDVPLLAFISNMSLFTMVSSTATKQAAEAEAQV
jgi:hypothetical protein